ncbi:EAL domain-containing protein (putative c-di-GMP-specific phosphodiesterase class I)/CHASE2 domain-containing sensor protein [Sphingomonas kaistensis]|uniref:EAL domain-containing protein (Putative c-di-GMP-specific phosphodiesterase class I)/CHASE2 domain-containing sensor protein n=1 Tax=Sphingomonas kaistensis TaxID=298708 RepID=A0A7X5Y7D9_9SPHN|nr:EAL domain-containing protein [Sphingomonas kaistensis]NJC06180.1 EAL domain-containing protein (putative c-di-GMP-specific phosphodiesterase class I)/CHASE2 domain-containing sensor protein [Sphingomonas kaistensis]
MGSDPASTKKEQARPWRLLLWSLGAALFCWAAQLGLPLEVYLRVLRITTHQSNASGDIVFVGIDDKSLSAVGVWPWPRRVQARLIDQATKAGASSIHLDIIYDSPSNPSDDRIFADALKKSSRVVLADRHMLGTSGNLKQPETRPLSEFRKHARTASISSVYDFGGIIWNSTLTGAIDGREVPTFAASLAQRFNEPNRQFWIDYSISPETIPYLSAADLIAGKFKPGALAGKQLIIGLNADQLGDQFWIPGSGRMAGANVQILGAETLKRGTPISLGTAPGMILALLATLAALFAKRPRSIAPLALTAALLVLLLGPLALERFYISADIVPGLLMLTIVSSRLAFLRWKRRGRVHEQTGLPNFAVLRSSGKIDRALVLAKIHNHAEITSALTEAEQQDAYRQVVARLSAGARNDLHQGDDGTFAWTLPNGAPIGNHLEALHSIFRSPVQVAGRQIDIAVTFGVELGVSRTLPNRIGSAVLAADEAWAEGLRWKLHDPARQEEVNWRVSLLGELDQAIDQGEVWLAYQPQFDIKQGKITGAEALARWTHPTKGPISPTEFVAAAEANGRIGKLTDFVLDRAISSGAAINRRGIEFQIAVNLSARLLADRDLLGRIETMLSAHGLPASRLTLELTETAALQDAESGLATLTAMRDLGIRIAIDDYGTGLSTLEYLKKIPASEIKIDQSFVKSMRVNRSDLIMVQSTIALAHSLDRSVVAEGVEDQQCLDDLRKMGCDIAQGFAIGRPMGVRELVQRLQIRSTRRAA